MKKHCQGPYVRQEALEGQLQASLERLSFPENKLAWVTQALRQSHGDEKRYHDEAIARLQAEQTKLQNRVDAAYLDKLDGRIDAPTFDRLVEGWRSEQVKLLRLMEGHQVANQGYLEAGIQILGLAHRAGEHFRKREGSSRRELLNLLVSNCSWRDGELQTTFRQPFDLIAAMNAPGLEEEALVGASPASVERWSGRRESNPRNQLGRLALCH